MFVANDGPRVYNAWATAHGDLFAPQRWADYRATAAAEAVARAKADVATRGLVATIVQNYYTLVAAVRKAASAQQSLNEAQTFLDITQRQERGGEVAHADVVKAQIQLTQRQRDAQDAELTALKSRLGLSVLVFPDFRETFAVVDDLQDVRATASARDRQVDGDGEQPGSEGRRSVGAAGNRPACPAHAAATCPRSRSTTGTASTRTSLPIYDPKGHRILGSAAAAQMTVPLWNWGATQSKLRQASCVSIRPRRI